MGYEGRAPRCGALSLLPWVGIILAVGLATVSFYPTTSVILIKSGEQLLLSAPMGPGDRLMYSYIHSVEKTMVREYFQVSEGALNLTHTEMQSYGAGLPSEHTDGFSFSQGWFSIPLNRSFEKIVLRASPATDQCLTTPTSSMSLNALPAGSTVEIEVTRRPVIWLRLKGVLN
jgi:hypothetical protein